MQIVLYNCIDFYTFGMVYLFIDGALDRALGCEDTMPMTMTIMSFYAHLMINGAPAIEHSRACPSSSVQASTAKSRYALR